ncbi:MAG TPA: YraN family protein [Bryobacteraceae bacterium]|nr:YraN family protein [Bryobacteraceae bacterium]
MIRTGEALDRARNRYRQKHWQEGLANGRLGEDLAHRYLQRKGYRIAGRNWKTRNRRYEADILAWDGEWFVVVEVKTRLTDEFGNPEDAVDREKWAHLRRAAAEYIRRAELSRDVVRFDVVSVVLKPTTRIVHYIDAFAWS